MKSNYIPAIFLLFLSAVVSIYASAKIPDNATQLAVLFPLKNSLQENINIANKANTPVVRLGSFDPIIVVEKRSEDSIILLYRAGAVAIFNPQILGNCLITQYRPI